MEQEMLRRLRNTKLMQKALSNELKRMAEGQTYTKESENIRQIDDDCDTLDNS